MLANPEYVPLFRSSDFTSLGEIEQLSVYREIRTIDRDVFYFSSSEIEKSHLDSDLFTPLIRREDIVEADFTITESDLNHYVLDLRGAIEKIES